jgi:hypothetical protein
VFKFWLVVVVGITDPVAWDVGVGVYPPMFVPPTVQTFSETVIPLGGNEVGSRVKSIGLPTTVDCVGGDEPSEVLMSVPFHSITGTGNMLTGAVAQTFCEVYWFMLVTSTKFDELVSAVSAVNEPAPETTPGRGP